MFEQQHRTPTHLWVEAKIKELNSKNIPAYILQRGEKMDGLIFLKISNCINKAVIVTQERNLDGDLEWIKTHADESIDEKQADEYLKRSSQRDPDIWIIEIEHRELDLDQIILS
ncbi:MAG: DUF1491 family protein [Pseudomonadota bacterium]